MNPGDYALVLSLFSILGELSLRTVPNTSQAISFTSHFSSTESSSYEKRIIFIIKSFFKLRPCIIYFVLLVLYPYIVIFTDQNTKYPFSWWNFSVQRFVIPFFGIRDVTLLFRVYYPYGLILMFWFYLYLFILLINEVSCLLERKRKKNKYNTFNLSEHVLVQLEIKKEQE